MPLYDYRCADCNLTFEVSRSFKDSDVPAYCPMCQQQAKRELSTPLATFTRGAAAESLRKPPGGASDGASRWSHHGHSHGPGAGSHTH